METNLFFFLEENGQWRKTVSRFWRKMVPPVAFSRCGQPQMGNRTFTRTQRCYLW